MPIALFAGIAASHSMEDHFLIMKVCHTVKHITMQREDHFVLGAISQSQVVVSQPCSASFILNILFVLSASSS